MAMTGNFRCPPSVATAFSNGPSSHKLLPNSRYFPATFAAGVVASLTVKQFVTRLRRHVRRSVKVALEIARNRACTAFLQK